MAAQMHLNSNLFAKKETINSEKGEIETEINKFNSEEIVADIKIINIKTSQTENEKEKTNSNIITTKTANEELKPEGREEINTNIESKTKKNELIANTKTKIK